MTDQPDPPGAPDTAAGTDPDVTEDEIGAFFDANVGRILTADGIPADAVEQMRARHIAAVLDSPAALAGMREMRRTVPPMAELLAPFNAPNLPRHGRGCLPHGYVAACNEDCNNIACPLGTNHDRCTVACLTRAGRELLFIPAWRRILLGGQDELL